MSEKGDRPSWDEARAHAPERPKYVASVTQADLIARPTRVSIAYAFVVLALIGTVFVNVIAMFGLDALRESMHAAIPDDLAESYADEDLENAVTLLLASAGVLILVLSLLQLFSIHSCHQHRRASGRTWLLVLTVLSVPVTILGVLLRSGDALDMWLSTAALVCLVIAVALLATPLVSQWLRQDDRPRSTPLAELQAPLGS